MRIATSLAAIVVALLGLQPQVQAQTFEMKDATYSAFAKGLFSEVTTVSGPTRFIFVAGIGAENDDGSVAHIGDFYSQCVMSYEKIKKILEAQGRNARQHRQGHDLCSRHEELQ
jgi:2-iminobutanoate/2-iminopropanoate deaminase